MLDFPRWKVLTILGVCLLFVVLSLPNALPPSVVARMPDWLPKRTVNLGLDLQGGSHLLLQVDFKAYLKEHVAGTVDGLRTELRKAKIGYQGLKAVNNKIQFTLTPGQGEKPNISRIVRQVDNGLEASEVSPGSYAVGFTDAALRDMERQLLDQSIEIVERRVNETGTREPIIQRQGDDRILLQVPGLQNPEHLKALLGKTAKMTFHLVNSEVSYDDMVHNRIPIGTELVEDQDEKLPDGTPVHYAIYSRALLTGEMLTGAGQTYDERGMPAVSFRFNSTGASRFAQITQENVGKQFAVVLDNKVITAPRIQTPILGGNGIITGNFTAQSANDLAVLLRAGALPAPLNVLEERSVGPSLGADSIQAGKHASILAVALVVGFMIVSYGLFGLFATMALVVNMVIIMAALSVFQATLTLPGIAGMVLTLGMAVDTNVLIYERIREEIRLGKSPFAAVAAGFKAAFGTIVDTHITTLITAVALYVFGTGTVKGFAVTLTIGVTASLFTAVLVTRMMVALWIKKVRPKRIPI
jgi:protein-export membrane protein SecD